ncbi:hypothetical protein JOD03_000531 [Chryseomicrobium aureum]|nr:hypothetical protein [Chryseomicrobium aureum]
MDQEMHKRWTKHGMWFAALHSLFVVTLAFDFIQFY